jgi:serine/threonine protein kinase/tetratricopeptide (TPR) repeat protein
MHELPTQTSLDAAPKPSSRSDATVDAPPDVSQDVTPQTSSCSDATVDAPPELKPQPPSHSDATVDLPQKPPDDSSLTVDHLTVDHPPTQLGDSADSGSDGASFELSDESCQVQEKAKNLVANYEVLGVLGRGAVGVVYKARQLGLNRLVALKMLLAGSHAGQRELARFRIEAEAVARLRHPNIVQVYEVGEHNGLPFFSLEFVEGGSLHQKMGGKPLPARDAAEIGEALSRAMYYAHQQNIIHRDLKPANILVTPDGVPKITDFGLAKRLEETEESSQTRTGTLMGTPSYMSPEQAEGRTRDIGPLSDQYTLGAILYEMLTGRPPFLGATLLDTIQQVRRQEPVPPTQLQAKTPHDLEVICLKSLQKEPSKRYGHAGELADDLRRFLRGEPIRARPVSLPERTWRWCRRNPRLASLYSAVCMLMLLAMVIGSVLGVRMLREQQAVTRIRDQAERQLQDATAAIYGGDIRRANDLLQWSDPLLDSAAALSEQRDGLDQLRTSVKEYGHFKELLDNVRFAYIFGSRSSRQQMEQGREQCRQLLELYDSIEQGRNSLPPLNAEQAQLFKDDVFDMFLVSALIESELSKNADVALQQQAAQQAIDWLNRAEKIQPGMRTLYAHRSGFRGTLGQREAADEDFRKARSITPTSAIDHFWHGYAEHLRGQGENARGEEEKAQEFFRAEIAEYAALLQQHPDHFWGHLSWAVAKVQLGDLQDALIGFTNCIRLRPDFAWPYNNRGTVHLRLEQYDQAVRDYDTALQRSSEYVVARSNRSLAYIAQGNVDQALEDCNQIVEKDPQYAPAYLNRAECYLRRKKFEEALSDCNRVLEWNQHKEEVHLKRQAIYEELKRSGDAPRLQRIQAQDMKKSLEFYNRAKKHVGRGENQQAVADYTTAIELYPRAGEPHYDRGLIYWKRLKDLDAALIDFRKVIAHWPKRPDAYRFLGMIHLGRRQYDLALQDLDEALSRQPDYPDALWGKAQIYLWQGKAKEALDVINPLVQKLPPGAEVTLNIRGDIYRRLGRLDDAAADYRRLITLRPKIVESYVGLAVVYCKQGEPAKARQCLDQLVEANPKSAKAYLERGRFLRDQGQFEEAWKDSEQAARCDAASSLPTLLQASITAARGDYATAVAETERTLAQAPKENGQVLYSAVQVLGIASSAAAKSGKPDLVQRYADRAAELLTLTLDKGFHDLNYPEHNRMIDDPALESIRQHSRARDLLAHRPQSNPSR